MRALRATVLAVSAVSLCALAGCGQAANQGAGGDLTSNPASNPVSGTTSPPSRPRVTEPLPPGSLPTLPTPSVLPSGPNVPQGATAVPKEQVDAGALPPFYKNGTVWVSDGGHTLTLTAAAKDACTGLTARVVEQSDSAVRIEIGPTDVPQGGSPDAPSFCAQVITPRVLTVELKAPLGNRKVYLSEGA
ncbi:MAG: hypothetical protein ACJ72N_13345 [Labedaea sp.]